MFNSLNNKEFGQFLKTLRLKLSLTQAAVRDLTGINTDTIRRIEIGQVIPRYETLALLSQVYKIDLVKKFSEHRSEITLVNIYSELDKCLHNYDVDGIRHVQNSLDENVLKSKTANKLINPIEVKQLKMYVDVLLLHFSSEMIDYNEAINKLQSALRLSIGSFSIKNFENLKYNPFELRILILYALMWSRNEHYDISNKILYFILDWISFIFPDEQIANHCLIKTHFNISYNYHMMYKYKNSLEHADLGIQTGLRLQLYAELYALYYRKFTAEYNLGIPTHLESLRKCMFFIDIIGNNYLLATYAEVTKAKYNIDIYHEFPYILT